MMNISPSYLTALKQRTGGKPLKSEILARIAKTLQEPKERIEASLTSKKVYIDNILSKSLHKDYKIREIVEWWSDATFEDQKIFYMLFIKFTNSPSEIKLKTLSALKNSLNDHSELYSKLENTPEHSKKRADIIWDYSRERNNISRDDIIHKSTFEDIFKKYQRRQLTDTELNIKLEEGIAVIIKELLDGVKKKSTR